MTRFERDAANQARPIRWMTRLITGLLAVLPLAYVPGFGSYTAVRYFLFGTVALILALLVSLIWARHSWIATRFFRKPILLATIGYLLTLILVSLTGRDPSISFFSNFQRTDGVFTFIFLTLFMLAVATTILIHGERVVRTFLKASVIGATILSLLITLSGDGLGVLVGGLFEQSRGGATLGNSSLAALYIVWNIFFALILLASAPGTKQKIGWGMVCAILLSSPLFLSYGASTAGLTGLIGVARAGALSLGIGFVVSLGAWLACDTHTKRRYVGRAILALILISACLAGFSLLKKTSALHEQFISTATGTRFVFWDAALAGFKERPLLGSGPGTFSEVYHEHLSEDIFLPENVPELLVNKAHNVFFESLAEGGIVLTLALVCLLAIVARGLWRYAKSHRVSGSLLMGAACAWLFQIQFIFDSIASLALLYVLIGVLLAGNGETAPADLKRIALSGQRRVLLSGLTLAIIVLFIYAIALPMRKAQVMYGVYSMSLPARIEAWSRLSDISPMGDSSDSVLMFTEVYKTYGDHIASLKKGSPQLRQAALDELDVLSQYVSGLLIANGEQYELLLVAAQLRQVRLLIDAVDAPLIISEEARELATRAAEISPADPRPREVLNTLKTLSFEGVSR